MGENGEHMKIGQVYAFYGKVRKIEKYNYGKDWRVLLIGLVNETGSHFKDNIWLDLPRQFKPKELKIDSNLRFEATVKKIEPRSYYDYHERETVELTPVCKLTDLSNITIEQISN